MAYSGQTNFFNIPYMKRGDYLTEEDETRRANLIDSLLYAATYGMSKGIIKDASYSLSGTTLTVSCPAGETYIFTAILNYRLAYRVGEALAFNVSSSGTYRLYLEYAETMDTSPEMCSLRIVQDTTYNDSFHLLLATITDGVLNTASGKQFVTNFVSHTVSSSNPHGTALSQDELAVADSLRLQGLPLYATAYRNILSAGKTGANVNVTGMDVKFATLSPMQNGIGNVWWRMANNSTLTVFNSGKTGKYIRVRIEGVVTSSSFSSDDNLPTVPEDSSSSEEDPDEHQSSSSTPSPPPEESSSAPTPPEESSSAPAEASSSSIGGESSSGSVDESSSSLVESSSSAAEASSSSEEASSADSSSSTPQESSSSAVVESSSSSTQESSASESSSSTQESSASESSSSTQESSSSAVSSSSSVAESSSSVESSSSSLVESSSSAAEASSSSETTPIEPTVPPVSYTVSGSLRTDLNGTYTVFTERGDVNDWPAYTNGNVYLFKALENEREKFVIADTIDCDVVDEEGGYCGWYYKRQVGTTTWLAGIYGMFMEPPCSDGELTVTAN